MEEKLAKGILLVDTVEFLRKKKGDHAIVQLEKSFGSLLFDQYRMYPLDDLLRLQSATMKLAFGGESGDGYKQLGAAAFESFTHGIVGATLTNVADSPRQLLEKIQELWGTVLNFGERKLIAINEANRHAVIEIKNDPRNPAYLQGVIEAGLKGIGLDAKTKIQSDKGDTYKIEISWQ
jgi:uncharacterized protein (TIGR02265 family)